MTAVTLVPARPVFCSGVGSLVVTTLWCCSSVVVVPCRDNPCVGGLLVGNHIVDASRVLYVSVWCKLLAY